MPRLSVLLPVHNGARTIIQAVTSTLRDLPPDSRLTILDDGSTDDTLSRLATLDDPRLDIIEGKGSGGLGNALNTLLESTDSHYIARMDADDITLPGRFYHSLRALERGNDLVFTSAITMRHFYTRPSSPAAIHATAFPYHLLLSNPVRHPTLCAYRTSIEAVDGYRQLPSEDYDLWIRAALAGLRMHKSSWYGLAYRIHDTQITAKAAWRERSHSDPAMNTQFAKLSKLLLGNEHQRLVSLEGSRDFQAQLTAFATDFDHAIGTLPRGQRLTASLKLRRRCAQVRASWPSKPTRG